ncbi:MAG: hypothetical protein UT57_C0009G0001 [Microgenomates group bacterium GW2011_GWC1_39_7]|nr:MAG: hypothetical protein UT57_C0009G0001 [Microgenomates group bacterium GW2011_GWC1_39_7]
MYLPLLEQFRNYLSSKGVSKITAKNYLSDIRKFLTWFETQFSRLFVATDLTVDVIELFEKTKGATIQNKNDTEYEILNTEYSSRSLERYLSALRKFAKFLVEEKLIDADPFEILNTKYEILNTKQDPWHLKEFRDYLYVYGAAKLTIKNYTVDILAFTKWIEITVLASRGEALQGQGISLINQELIEDYKERLTSVLELSPKSVNRKLSSIRKYLQFAVAQNLIKDLPFVASQGETLRGLRAQTGLNLDDLKETEDNQQPIINNQYSKFPPLRLLQKMFVPYELLEDRLSSKIARAIRNFRLANRVSKFAFRRTTNDKRRTFPIGNIPKVAYAPQQISLANKAWHKKLFHHARYTRPNWYKRYHSYAFTHYFHFAILVIYASLIGFLIYTALFSETQDKQALAAPVAPPRILSFQGRLTDQNDNPITTATDLRFQVYDDSSTTGSGNLLWQEVIEVSPDQDGIFSELLGNGSTCTGQPLTVQQTRCAIPSSVFTDNSALYLGISVENTAELTPRQRLATVAYAANSESLQGMLPITDAAVTDNVNTILALDSSGNLTMDGATTPTFQATGGQFKISGQPLLLTTNTGTSNNVIIDPDGIGKVDVRKPLANTTATGNISPGGVEVDDKFGVLATESAVAAFVVNNNTTGGDIFTASSSGTTRFTLSNAGVASFVGGQTADITSLGNANLTVSAGGTGDLRLLSDSDTDILLPYPRVSSYYPCDLI